MGLVESLFFHVRRIPNLAKLPPAVRAELEADEALEPEEEDGEDDGKDERDELV
jgi:CDP-diacylglycerol--serine O-phosphatidyltransferase